jgi:hypothetical protein
MTARTPWCRHVADAQRVDVLIVKAGDNGSGGDNESCADLAPLAAITSADHTPGLRWNRPLNVGAQV